MCKEVWKVSMSDGTNSIEVIADKVEWPLATDGFVLVYTYVDLSTAELLDKWDGGKVGLSVDIDAQNDQSAPYPPCPDEVLDYDSISGTAIIKDPRFCISDAEGNEVCGGWQYDAGTKRAVIPLLFSEYE